MKRSILMLVVLLMTCTTISGCIIVPWGYGHFDDDFHDGGHRGGGGHGGGGRGRH